VTVSANHVRAGDDAKGEVLPSPGAVRDRQSRQGIQSVEIAMTVLLALEDGAGPMSLSQVAARANMQPSKAHRYLVSLARAGLVTQGATSGQYDLGPALRRMGAEALRRMDEVGLASQHLPGLRDRTQHAVNLAVWGDNGPIVVRWDYGAYALPVTVRVGATMPLLSSAIGRVFLAYMPESLTAPVLKVQYGPDDASPFDADEIEQIKATVRGEGMAFTSGSLIPDLASLAAPVFTAETSLPLAVAIALPKRQATPRALRALSAELQATTRRISAEIGSAISGDRATRLA
jgi:DNA-binding IclR family transcriptional regulator